MKKFRLNIDGKEVFGLPGQTILDVAKEMISIFNSALMKEQKIYGSCGICVVEWKAIENGESLATESHDLIIKTRLRE